MHPIRQTGLVDGADWLASDNYDERPDEDDISVLVIHAISLPPDRFGGPHVCELFTNSLDPDADPYFAEICHLRVSAHFFIPRDGQLIQLVATRDRAWHAGESEFDGRSRVNDFSIGVELEGCDTIPFEPGQYRTLADLTGLLQAAYPAITARRIVGHNDIAPGRKTDPGPCFDWAYYRSLLDQ